ncbi:fuculose phosphate aldolase [Enterococcus florum]|uniref:Fuculose phosphate aldolase n=1 Tax=Enterococcus florum TaxID=2480627 RepID=A0A4P5PAA6_9ENTE|nr:L-fuculose-phosphate aldolase [Enterococcus florum]GCF93171.1 fuculose phosphate aldolase [Enterococcus florum]
MLETIKQQIVDYGKKLIDSGLTSGTGGNVSIFDPNTQLMAISPSGIDYAETTGRDVVLMDLTGNVVEGERKPSSEWQMHLIYYQKRGEEIGAVVHAHSTCSTILATCRKELPATNYMIALAGGNNVRCSEYATFGTRELAEASFEAMKDRYACFLANHGLLTCGKDIQTAFSTAVEIERLAGLHIGATLLGGAVVLPDDEMERMKTAFQSYGQVKE